MNRQANSFALALLFAIFGNISFAEESKPYGDIPETIEAAFVILDDTLSQDDIDTLRGTSADGLIHYHFGLGTWMRSNWGLWKGSKLSRLISSKGVDHPEDISMVIIECYWHYLNGRAADVDDVIQVQKRRHEKLLGGTKKANDPDDA